MNKLKELRARHQMSQARLGELVGESQQVVSHWETGRSKPAPYQMQMIEDYFGEPKEEIFFTLFNYKNELNITK